MFACSRGRAGGLASTCSCACEEGLVVLQVRVRVLGLWSCETTSPSSRESCESLTRLERACYLARDWYCMSLLESLLFECNQGFHFLAEKIAKT